MSTELLSVGRYIEFTMATEKADERVRVTLVENPSWLDQPTIRIQKRDYRGKLAPGPEFPASQAMSIVAAISQLVTEGEES